MKIKVLLSFNLKAKYVERNQLQIKCDQEKVLVTKQKIKLKQLNRDFDELDKGINKLVRELRNIDYVPRTCRGKVNSCIFCNFSNHLKNYTD